MLNVAYYNKIPIQSTFSLFFCLMVNRPELLRQVVAVWGASMGRCCEAARRGMLWQQSSDSTPISFPQAPVKTVDRPPEDADPVRVTVRVPQ